MTSRQRVLRAAGEHLLGYGVLAAICFAPLGFILFIAWIRS